MAFPDGQQVLVSACDLVFEDLSDDESCSFVTSGGDAGDGEVGSCPADLSDVGDWDFGPGVCADDDLGGDELGFFSWLRRREGALQDDDVRCMPAPHFAGSAPSPSWVLPSQVSSGSPVVFGT